MITMEKKKSVMGPVISVFVMILVVSILVGLTFLFVSSLKTNVVNSSPLATVTVNNESGHINSTGYTLSNASALNFRDLTFISVLNGTDNTIIAVGNWTANESGYIVNATAVTWNSAKFSYTYRGTVGEGLNAYKAVNSTEEAGATVVGYLPLIFLAIIFGAILTLVLKIILPYINLGQTMGGF